MPAGEKQKLLTCVPWGGLCGRCLLWCGDSSPLGSCPAPLAAVEPRAAWSGGVFGTGSALVDFTVFIMLSCWLMELSTHSSLNKCHLMLFAPLLSSHSAVNKVGMGSSSRKRALSYTYPIPRPRSTYSCLQAEEEWVASLLPLGKWSSIVRSL